MEDEVKGLEPTEGAEVVDAPAGPEAAKTFGEDYVKGLRAENAGYRTKLRTLEERVAEFERSAMTETERLQAEAKANAEKATKAEQALRSARWESSLSRAVAKHGADYELVAKLVDQEFDEDGEPVAVEAKLVAVLDKYPQLRGNPSVEPTNPGRGRRTLTIDDIRKMSLSEAMSRQDEIDAVLSASRN